MEYYNYLFLNIKSESAMSMEELAISENVAFERAISEIEKDLERKMQFENYIIERIKAKKND